MCNRNYFSSWRNAKVASFQFLHKMVGWVNCQKCPPDSSTGKTFSIKAKISDSKFQDVHISSLSEKWLIASFVQNIYLFRKYSKKLDRVSHQAQKTTVQWRTNKMNFRKLFENDFSRLNSSLFSSYFACWTNGVSTPVKLVFHLS